MTMSSGCQWMEKTFSVSMSGRTHGLCTKCSQEIRSVVYKHNGDMLCRACFSNLPVKCQNLGESFYTPPDRLWKFTDRKNFPQDVEIISKGQFNRLCKKHGLHWDRPQGRAMKPTEYIKPEDKKIDRRFVANEIKRELQAKGLSEKLMRRR